MKNFVFILFLILSSNCLSQKTIKISGVITNKNQLPVADANIIVLDSLNTIITYGISDSDGKYNLQLNKNRDRYFIVKISSLGYKNVTYSIPKRLQENFFEKKIILEESIESLNEVFIIKKSPITVLKDTVTYNADAFRKTDDEVVEDLLKNLPGVKVNEDGDITVNGQEIRKIIVDGKDVFDTNYKILSKNIDSRDIEEVKIINNYNDNALLKNLVETGDIVLDIGFKNDRKGAVYGNITGGYGYKDRYELNPVLFTINDKISVFNITNINTVGKYGSTLLSKQNKKVKFFKPNNQSSFVNTSLNIPINNVDDAYLQDGKTSFNSANFYKEYRKTKVRLENVFAYDNLFTELSSSERFIDATTIATTNNNQKRVTGNTTKVFLEYLYKENINFKFQGSFDYSNIDFERRGFVNQTITNGNFNQEIFYVNSNLETTFKLSDKSALQINTFLFNEQNPKTYTLLPSVFISEQQFEQNILNPKTTFGFIGDFIKKRSSLQFGYIQENSSLQSQSPFVTNDFGFSNFLNDVDFKNTSLYLNKRLEYNFLFDTVLQLDLITGYSFYRINDRVANISTRGTNPLITPGFKISKNTEKLGKFTFGYIYTNKIVDVVNVYANPIATSPVNFSLGYEGVLKNENHRFRVTHSASNFRKQFFYNASISHTIQVKGIGSEFFIQDDFTFFSQRQVNGNSLSTFGFELDKVLSKSKIALSGEYTVLYRRNRVSVDQSSLNRFESILHKPKIIIASIFNEGFNFKVGGQSFLNVNRINEVRSSVNNVTSFASVDFSIKDIFSIALKSDQIYPNSNNDNKRIYNLISLDASYIVKKNKLTLFLKSQNIFDEKEIIQSFINPVSTINTRTRLTPFLIYAGLKWRF